MPSYLAQRRRVRLAKRSKNDNPKADVLPPSLAVRAKLFSRSHRRTASAQITHGRTGVARADVALGGLRSWEKEGGGGERPLLSSLSFHRRKHNCCVNSSSQMVCLGPLALAHADIGRAAFHLVFSLFLAFLFCAGHPGGEKRSQDAGLQVFLSFTVLYGSAVPFFYFFSEAPHAWTW